MQQRLKASTLNYLAHQDRLDRSDVQFPQLDNQILGESIMFPSPVGFGFYEDAVRFIGVLAVLAILGDAYSFYIFYIHEENWYKKLL